MIPSFTTTACNNFLVLCPLQICTTCTTLATGLSIHASSFYTLHTQMNSKVVSYYRCLSNFNRRLWSANRRLLSVNRRLLSVNRRLWSCNRRFELQNSHKALKEEIVALSMKFRVAEDRLQRDINELKKRQRVQTRGAYADIQNISNKINSGLNGLRSLNITEQPTLKHMSKKCRIGEGIVGLLACQNRHCHHTVSMASIAQCRKLAANNDVFQHFHVKGRKEEIIKFVLSTEHALKMVKNFVQFNPHVGTSIHMKSGRGKVSWKGKYRREGRCGGGGTVEGL